MSTCQAEVVTCCVAPRYELGTSSDHCVRDKESTQLPAWNKTLRYDVQVKNESHSCQPGIRGFVIILVLSMKHTVACLE